MKRVSIKQVRSTIGTTKRQRATMRGLGLRRVHHVVVRTLTPALKGMLVRVNHLIEIT